MNKYYTHWAKVFALLMMILTTHAVSAGGTGKIIGADSETNLSGTQLLDDIDPNIASSVSISNTGYDHLKGKIIQYVFDLYNGNSQAKGMIIFTVNADGQIHGAYQLDFASVANHDYDYHYKYMNGRPINNIINKAVSYRSIGYGNGYGAPYDGMTVLDNMGISVINTEGISFPPYMSAKVTPAGLTVNLNGELTGIYHTTFIPWPKNRVTQARYNDNEYESRLDSDSYINSLFFFKDLK